MVVLGRITNNVCMGYLFACETLEFDIIFAYGRKET